MSTAPWYFADGSVVMLPAEEVERMRKAAAAVLKAAEQAWIRQDCESMLLLGVAVMGAAREGCYGRDTLSAPPTTPAPGTTGGDHAD